MGRGHKEHQTRTRPTRRSRPHTRRRPSNQPRNKANRPTATSPPKHTSTSRRRPQDSANRRHPARPSTRPTKHRKHRQATASTRPNHRLDHRRIRPRRTTDGHRTPSAQHRTDHPTDERLGRNGKTTRTTESNNRHERPPPNAADYPTQARKPSQICLHTLIVIRLGKHARHYDHQKQISFGKVRTGDCLAALGGKSSITSYTIAFFHLMNVARRRTS